MLNQIRISLRLTISFGIIIALLFCTAAVSLSRMRTLDQAANAMSRDIYPKSVTFNKLIMNLDALEISMGKVLIEDDAERRREEMAAMVAQKAVHDDDLLRVGKLMASAKGKEMYIALRASDARYSAGLNRFMQLVAAGDTRGAIALLHGSLREDIRAVREGMWEMTVLGGQLMHKSSQDIHTDYRSSVTLISGTFVAAVVLAIVFAVTVTRSITLPLGQAREVAHAVAAGDLSSRVVSHAGDETGRMVAALHDMRAGLSDIVAKVRHRAEVIHAASAEIATGNMDLSLRTEQQAGSLEETASAMEQLTAAVRHNADNSRQAGVLAASAAQLAREGGEMVDQVVTTMNRIDVSSKKVADIIGVIDAIAFQTNILALNAAVEAARAGAQGRGFAVVAQEVRGLAQRCAAAAGEINRLIADSGNSVNAGTQLVQQAGQTIAQMVDSVSKVATIVGDISAASQEQSVGISEVNNAIAHMDQVTQENAALVEQAAAATQSMQDQASALNGLMRVFRLTNPSPV